MCFCEIKIIDNKRRPKQNFQKPVYGSSCWPYSISKILNNMLNACFITCTARTHRNPGHTWLYKYKCKNKKLCDTFKTFNGLSCIKDIANTYLDCVFCSCLERYLQDFYFSKIVTATLTNQCLPIYLMATKIYKFFNHEGITRILTESEKSVLKICTSARYKPRSSIVLELYPSPIKRYTEHFNYIRKLYHIN